MNRLQTFNCNIITTDGKHIKGKIEAYNTEYAIMIFTAKRNIKEENILVSSAKLDV